VTDTNLFDAGNRLGEPTGDPAREAIASLRGYAYQLYASALAWLRLTDGETLYLEVAEDYAIAAKDALEGVQVKDTAASGTITIRSVVASLDAFVDLVGRNADRQVTLRYLTTATIGLERAAKDRIEGEPALAYWRRAAKGAPIAPLRDVLLGLKLEQKTIDFIQALDDDELRDALVRRIHWDSGQAPIDDLADELQAGLIEFASSTLRLSADIGRRMADLVLAAVLKVSIKPDHRRLRRADLIEVGESLGRVSVPRAVLEALMGGTNTGPAHETLLIPGEATPAIGPVAARQALVQRLREMLDESSFVVITGSTGRGKTYVATEAARVRSGGWNLADLRGITAGTAAARLKTILGEATAAPTDIVILDDLDCLDDPSVLRSVRRLVAAMRRRDGIVIVTCASEPTRRTMEAICGLPDVAVEVPYLTVDEVTDLIEQAGGSRSLGRLIYLASSAGHPQLVQAAILHMRSANWSRSAIRELLGGQAADIEEERRAARDRLVAAMPSGARAMLYRTSLILGRFTRELALSLADVDPAIAEPGTEIDRLVGPWIERPARTELRVSPLVADAGNEALSPEERRRVHQAVAGHLLAASSISVSEGDTVLHHAMEGGAEHQVFAYASSLMTSSSETLELLARHSPAIASLPTDKPIFAANSFLSVLLRLGQLLVTLSGDDTERAAEVWAAMRSEMVAEGEMFEVLVLSKILNQTTIVEAIPEWLELVLRYDVLSQTNERLKAIAEEIGQLDHNIGGELQGFAFIYQGTALSSTGALRAALEKLDSVTPEVRARLFSGLNSGAGNYGHLVESAWLRSAKTEGFDGEQAADDYLAMAKLAERWDIRALAGRCHAARAIMLDEYVKSQSRALAALDEAEKRLGPMTSISRARAKIQWRQHDHENALRGLESVWNDTASDSDEVERAFIAREAGISAAETGRWTDARTWFERARASFGPFESGSVPSLKIGLGADAAQAAFKSGDAVGAVEGYARAFEELSRLDPDSSLSAAYCHRVLRHAALWLMRQTGDEGVDVDVAELPPGACSNPEPKEAIRGLPLAPLDLAWYLLADAALDLGQDDFFYGVHNRLAAGPILGLEVGRQQKLAKHLVTRADARAVVAALQPYGSGLAYLEAEQPALLAGDLMNPTRGTFPLYALDGSEPTPAKRGATDLLVSFGLLRAIAGDGEALRKVRTGVAGDDWSSVRGVAKLMVGADGSPSVLAEFTAASIGEVALAGGSPVDPAVAFRATVRFLLWAGVSAFRNQLADPVGVWTSATWQAIIDQHRFRLRNPDQTADHIAAALASLGSHMGRAARIALAVDAAVTMVLPDSARAALAEIAKT
jgi:hypothetical protein